MTRYAITFTCPTTGVERTWIGEYEDRTWAMDHGYSLADKGFYEIHTTTLPLADYDEFWEGILDATPWQTAMIKIEDRFTESQVEALSEVFDIFWESLNELKENR